MNATGDGEQQPYSERLPRDLPLSAPVAADISPDRTTGHYAEYPPPSVPPAGAAGPQARHAAGEGDSGRGEGEAGAGWDDRPGVAPEPPPQPSYLIAGGQDAPPEDPTRVILRKHLDALRVRAASASSWLETSVHFARMVNRDGVVPVTARFSRDDIEFLGRAREEVLGFAELGLRLLELHAPLDAGGISTDPSSPILRCRSCMWRWPCPTFRVLTDAVSQLPRPGSPGR